MSTVSVNPEDRNENISRMEPLLIAGKDSVVPWRSTLRV